VLYSGFVFISYQPTVYRPAADTNSLFLENCLFL
jgi:hypothetical protein